MPTIKWSAVERQLTDMDRPELIALLRDLFKSSDTARTFLAMRVLGGDGGETLEKYRKRVVGQFFPARGMGKLDLREARRSIREYQKSTADITGTIDLLLSYVEAGTEFTNSFGDINETFYRSLEAALGEMADLLRTPAGRPQYGVFQPRLDRMLGSASSIGWGYSDAVDEILDQLDADAGSWAESEVDERDV
jgi:hypothetical protein